MVLRRLPAGRPASAAWIRTASGAADVNRGRKARRWQGWPVIVAPPSTAIGMKGAFLLTVAEQKLADSQD